LRASIEDPNAEKSDLQGERARGDSDCYGHAFAAAERVRKFRRASNLSRARADHYQLERDCNHPENAVDDSEPGDDVKADGDPHAPRIGQRVDRHGDSGDGERYGAPQDEAGAASGKQ
jgi:hypothetical protein